MFETELHFFIEKQTELVAKYAGKILVLRGNEVVGAFDSVLQAIDEASKKFQIGTFMIQPCVPGPQAYTVNVNSSLGIQAP